MILLDYDKMRLFLAATPQPDSVWCDTQLTATRALLTADPGGAGVVDAELWFEQVVHGEPGPAAAGKLRWDNKQEQSPVKVVRCHRSTIGGPR